MKRIFIAAAALLGLASFAAFAQDGEIPAFNMNETGFMSKPKVGAFVIGSYKYSDAEGAHGGPGFGLRLIRAYVDGSIFTDFKYRVQMQFGNGTHHVKDFYVEWAKYDFFSVKIGQFKRAFTFENPMNPWDVGAGDYSFLVQKFAGMGDRLGEANMGGRDLGIQAQGDFLKIGEDKHNLFHYQIGIWNGQGINLADANGHKDIIGTFQVQPIKGLYAGVFAWKGDWVNPTSGDVFKRERLSYGVKFDRNNWTFRSEYAHNIAGEKDQTYNFVDKNNILQTYKKGKAYAFYATLGVPVLKWLKLYAKWDYYEDSSLDEEIGKEVRFDNNMYSAIANFRLHKNLNFQLEYRRHNDHFGTKREFNEIWLQTYVRF